MQEITRKFEWTLNGNRIENIISTHHRVKIFFFFFFFFFFEVSARLDVRHCPKLQSCAISRKSDDATLKKWQKPLFRTQFGVLIILENGKNNFFFDAILAPLAKLWIHKIFFVDFKLDFVEIVTIYQPNLRKWQKN